MSKKDVLCPNCEDNPLIEFWRDDILFGYYCKSHKIEEYGLTELGCGVLIEAKEYKRLKDPTIASKLTSTAQTPTQSAQKTTQQNESPPDPNQPWLANFQPRVLSISQRMMLQLQEQSAQRALLQNQTGQIKPPIQLPGQSIKTPQFTSPITPTTPTPGQIYPGYQIRSSDPTAPQIIVTDPEKLTKLRPVLTAQDRINKLRNKSTDELLKIQRETYANMLLSSKGTQQNKEKKLKDKYGLKNTSSEEEEKRLAEEKKKGKFKRPKKKKLNKKLIEATLKSAENGSDDGVNGDESDDYEDGSDNSDGFEVKNGRKIRKSGWNSDASEESSEPDDDLFDDDDALYPETEQDRIDEEADQMNALLGDNDKDKNASAKQVFEDNAPLSRQDVITQERLQWAGYSNDQYEVHRAPMEDVTIDERFLKFFQTREDKRFATLGVNWNALPSQKPGKQFVVPKMIEKVKDEEIKDDKTLLFEQFQQERLARQLARIEIPVDYKPIRIWAPSEELLNDSEFAYSTIEVPPLVGHKLRPHQREGVQFLAECVLRLRSYNGCGAILADDMGLGKTLQSVALIYTLLTQGFFQNQPIAKKIIVCCPTSLVQNWANEFEKWLGKGIVNVVAMVDSGPKQKDTLRQFTKGFGQVLVVSYDTLRRHIKSIINPDSDRSGAKKPNAASPSSNLDLEDIEDPFGVDNAMLDDLNLFNEDGSPLCDLLICDEAHRLKNHATQTYKSLNDLPCKRRVLLSGTPMQNDLKEFYSMVNFANPDLLGTIQEFSTKFQNPIVNGREPNAPKQIKSLGQQLSFELSRIVSKFILRRTNTLLSQHLPPKTIEIVCSDMSPLQKAIYKIITGQKAILELLGSELTAEQALLQSLFNENAAPDEMGDDDDDDDGGGKKKKGKKGGDAAGPSGNGGKILPMLNMLRGIANHPKIVYDQIHRKAEHLKGELEDKILAEYPPEFLADGAHPKYSGKIHTLDRLICAVRARSNDRFVLISNFTETLDLIQQLCEYRNWKYLRVDGSTSTKNRQANVDKLCKKGSDYAVFLLSSKAGGCGLNLVGANRLVLIDPDWNPAVDKQAAGRIWRDGQPKRCFVYRFLSTGTIDEKIFQRQLSKDGLTEIMSGNNQDAQVTTDELKKLFVYNEDDNLLHPSDTHRTLDCCCVSNSVQYAQFCTQHGKNAVSTMMHPDYFGGEKPDYSLSLFTTPENPFSRPTSAIPGDHKRVKYPYILDTDKSKDNDEDRPVQEENNNADVPFFIDPAQNLCLDPSNSTKPPPNSRLQPMPRRSNSSASSSSQGGQDEPHASKYPSLLQKGWAREQDLEYWSHHTHLLTIPDPLFRDAIKDCYDEKAKGKLDLTAFGDSAPQIRFNPRYSCNLNMVTMVMALEVTGKPLAEDMKGLAWKPFSSLTFRHGQPQKKMTKMEMDILSEASDDDDDDDDKGDRKKRGKKKNKNDFTMFNPKTHVWDSEEDVADYSVNPDLPRSRLPLSLETDASIIAERKRFFDRQRCRITNSRKQYEKLLATGRVPKRSDLVHEQDDVGNAKGKAAGKGAQIDGPSAAKKRKARLSNDEEEEEGEFIGDTDGSDSERYGPKKSQKRGAKKGSHMSNDGTGLDSSSNKKRRIKGKYVDPSESLHDSDDDYEKLFNDAADADDAGNLQGFIGGSGSEDDGDVSGDDSDSNGDSSESSESELESLPPPKPTPKDKSGSKSNLKSNTKPTASKSKAPIQEQPVASHSRKRSSPKVIEDESDSGPISPQPAPSVPPVDLTCAASSPAKPTRNSKSNSKPVLMRTGLSPAAKKSLPPKTTASKATDTAIMKNKQKPQVVDESESEDEIQVFAPTFMDDDDDDDDCGIDIQITSKPDAKSASPPKQAQKKSQTASKKAQVSKKTPSTEIDLDDVENRDINSRTSSQTSSASTFSFGCEFNSTENNPLHDQAILASIQASFDPSFRDDGEFDPNAMTEEDEAPGHNVSSRPTKKGASSKAKAQPVTQTPKKKPPTPKAQTSSPIIDSTRTARRAKQSTTDDDQLILLVESCEDEEAAKPVKRANTATNASSSAKLPPVKKPTMVDDDADEIDLLSYSPPKSSKRK